MKNSNKSAFTILEILLAAVIFVVTVAGVFATLGAVRAPLASKNTSLSAAVFGKQVLEALRSQVNTTSYYTCVSLNNGVCGDFSLFLGPHNISSTTLGNNGISWPPALLILNPSGNLGYTVTCADGTGNCSSFSSNIARKVDLIVTSS